MRGGALTIQSPGAPAPSSHRVVGWSGGVLKGHHPPQMGFMMVPHVVTALWQRPEQIRENLPGKWVGVWQFGGFSGSPLGFGALGVGCGAAGEGAGSSRAWVSLLKQHHPRSGFLRRGEPPIGGRSMIWPFLSHFRTQEVGLLEKVSPAVPGRGAGRERLARTVFLPWLGWVVRRHLSSHRRVYLRAGGSGLMAHPLPGAEPEAWAGEVGGSKKVLAEPARVRQLTRHQGRLCCLVTKARDLEKASLSQCFSCDRGFLAPPGAWG